MCANFFEVMDEEDVARFREFFSDRKKAEKRPEMEVIEERMNGLVDDCERAGFVCRKVSVFEFSAILCGFDIVVKQNLTKCKQESQWRIFM